SVVKKEAPRISYPSLFCKNDEWGGNEVLVETFVRKLLRLKVHRVTVVESSAEQMVIRSWVCRETVLTYLPTMGAPVTLAPPPCPQGSPSAPLPGGPVRAKREA